MQHQQAHIMARHNRLHLTPVGEEGGLVRRRILDLGAFILISFHFYIPIVY